MPTFPAINKIILSQFSSYITRCLIKKQYYELSEVIVPENLNNYLIIKHTLTNVMLELYRGCKV